MRFSYVVTQWLGILKDGKINFFLWELFYERDEMKRGEICCASFINRIVREIVLMLHEAIS